MKGSGPGEGRPALGDQQPSGEVSRIEPFDASPSEWDALTGSLQGSSFCHLGSWRTVMGAVLGHALHYRMALDGAGRVQGALPMVRVRSRLFGDYLISMPFLSYGGPLGTEAARALLASEAVREARDFGVDLLELRSRTPVPGTLQTSERKLTVLLDLPDSPQVLWEQRFSTKLRTKVRRSQKEGMEVRFGHGLLGSFYQVFAQTMRDLGTPVLPREFFEEAASGMGQEIVVGVVFWRGQAVAAGCGFLWRGELEVTWSGAVKEVRKIRPNMLLLWSFMEEALRRGAHTFNFGRSTPESGTHQFKRQWGGRDQPLPWAQWAPGSVRATPTPTGTKYKVATALWKRMPLSVTNRLGPFISRSLP